MTFQYLPVKEPRFKGSVAYWRFDWVDLEPKEGEYNWHFIDTALNAWSKKGRKFAFRIMTTNSKSKTYYSSPKWLFDKGCKGYEYVYDNKITNSYPKKLKKIEVDYNDSIFIHYHTEFIKALAERYDGNEKIEFIDIGSYGYWGEWHTPHPASYENKLKIFNTYFNCFKRTRLIAMSLDTAITNVAVKKNIGLGRDGIGLIADKDSWYKRYKDNKIVMNAWDNVPVVFEWYASFKVLNSRPECSFTQGLQFMYDNHVTYINDNLGDIPDSIYNKLIKLGQKSGYNFLLKEVENPSEIIKGNTLPVKMKWENTGLAPIYQKYDLWIYLLNEKHGIEYSENYDINILSWLPGEENSIVENISIPNRLKNKKYYIGISLKNSKMKNILSIPIDTPCSNGIYIISEVKIM